MTYTLCGHGRELRWNIEFAYECWVARDVQTRVPIWLYGVSYSYSFADRVFDAVMLQWTHNNL